MAFTPDQIFMLAGLADFAGQKLAPDNPFAGYAQNAVATRNFAKMLQQPGTGQAPAQGAASAAPASNLAAPGISNPFDPNYQPLQLPDQTQGVPSIGKSVMEGFTNDMDLNELAFLPGVDFRSDADNNVTIKRSLPATTNLGSKKKEPPAQQTSDVTNPFRYLG